MNTAAIEKATGKSWADWLAFLETINAKDLPHKEIAQRVHEDGGVSGWWSQGITVAYEQHIGRRQPGQDCNGEFTVSVSKTLAGTMNKALKQWLALVADRHEFSDIPISRPGEVSRTDKWRYWRCGLADGSRVNANIYQKEPGKVSIGLEHDKLESSEQVEHWRAFWKELLASL